MSELNEIKKTCEFYIKQYDDGGGFSVNSTFYMVFKMMRALVEEMEVKPTDAIWPNE